MSLLNNTSFSACFKCLEYITGPYIARGQGGQLPPPGKLNVFFFLSNIVFEFAGLFLVAILVRNLKKTD